MVRGIIGAYYYIFHLIVATFFCIDSYAGKLSEYYVIVQEQTCINA